MSPNSFSPVSVLTNQLYVLDKVPNLDSLKAAYYSRMRQFFQVVPFSQVPWIWVQDQCIL